MTILRLSHENGTQLAQNIFLINSVDFFVLLLVLIPMSGRKTGKIKRSKSSKICNEAFQQNKLASKLSWGFLNFPNLLEELPMMITSLDAFEYLNIGSISDPTYKSFLLDLMADLPVECDPQRGWSKKEECSINQYVLKSLLVSKSIIQPNELSISESQSYRSGVPKLLSICNRFPDLRFEMQNLIESLLEGVALQLGGIENEDVKEDLTRLFGSLGLELDDDDAFVIPSNSRKAFVIESLNHLKNIFTCADAYAPLSAEEIKQGYKSQSKSGAANSDGSSSDSSDSEDSDEFDSSDDYGKGNESNTSGKYKSSSSSGVGPLLPSSQQLAQAQALAQVGDPVGCHFSHSISTP